MAARKGEGRISRRDPLKVVSSNHASKRTGRARTLRQSSSTATTRVWERLRGSRIDGHKFRREHAIGPFYADFACDRLRLVIEIDGGVHELEEVKRRDAERQAALEGLEWTVLRFTNDPAACFGVQPLKADPHPFACPIASLPEAQALSQRERVN